MHCFMVATPKTTTDCHIPNQFFQQGITLPSTRLKLSPTPSGNVLDCLFLTFKFLQV